MLTYSCKAKCDLDGCPVPIAGTPLDTLVSALRQLRPVQALCEESRCFVQDFTSRLDVDRHAWSLEVCPRTWTTYHRVKIHLHLAAVRSVAFKWKRHHVLWGDVAPRSSRSCPGSLDKRPTGPASIMFYCQIPKIGQLVCGGSREPFHDNHVNPEWVTNLLQAQ